MKHTDTTPACIGRRFLALPAMLVVSAVLLFVSCTNLFEKEIIADSPVFQVANPAADTVYLAVSVGDFSRAAFPTDLSVLNWTISVTKNDDTAYVPEPVTTVSQTDAASLVCAFRYAGEGAYTVTLNGYTKTDPAVAVCTGTRSVDITPLMVSTAAVPVVVTVTATDTTVPGDISLILAAAEGSAITGFSVQCTSDTETLTEKTIAGTSGTVSGTLKYTGVTPGVYTMTINALNSAGELVYVRIEKVTVCPGLTTGTWVMSDGSTSDTLTITDDMLFSTFYVAGSSGTFYTAAQYGARTGNDDSGTGYIDSPFATVSRAVKKCAVTGKAYTVYVDGTVTESDTITIPENINVTVKSLTAGTDESAIAPTATIAAESTATIANMITVNSGATLTMTGITLKGNNAVRGITVTKGTCTLTNCIITDQKADNGAGIYIDTGTVTINNTQITNCTATGNGGGIYVTGDASVLTMNSGKISYNTANFGGGVWTSVGLSLSSKDAVITENTANKNGGGMYVSAGTFAMSAGEISNNKALDSYGGGVQLGSGEHTMSGGTISGNTAGDGGGVRTAGMFTMSGTAEISGNTATSGGGIYVPSGGTFNMNNGTVSGNNSTGNGGGVWTNGTFNMSGGTIGGSAYYSTSATDKTNMGNSAASSAQGGGGVYMSGGTFNMTGGSICSNTAPGDGGQNGRGAGVYMSGGMFTMSTETGTTATPHIFGNTANWDGGGVYMDGSTFTMYNPAKVSGNNAANKFGGGVYVNSGTFYMKGGTVGGSKVYAESDSVDDKKDMGNWSWSGGGVYVTGTCDMSAGTIGFNTAGTDGGGVSVYTSGKFTMSGDTSRICDNIANGSGDLGGGGVMVSGTFTMENGSITGNTAPYGGGVWNSNSCKINGGSITGNTATISGGNVYKSAGTFTSSVTITDIAP